MPRNLSSPVEFWEGVVPQLGDRVPRRSFETWIRPILPLKINQCDLVLGVPNAFFLDWVDEHFRTVIEEEVEREAGTQLQIHFEVHDNGDGFAWQEHSAEATGASTPHGPSSGNGRGRAGSGRLQSIHSRHTFEDFVVGPSNEFAIAAALAVVDQPGRSYNPLFLHGGSGLGKTHILHAIGEKIRRRQPELKSLYKTSESFMLEMIGSIQRGTTIDFKRKYRGVDVLLIDDVQFLSGKESTQEEFFHTFNALYDAHKQIVITADCAPREIKSLEERLISRMGWGLVCDIQPPTFETRVAILRKFAEYRKLDLRDDVAILIANHVKSNIRELESCLTRLQARAANEPGRVDVAFAQRALRDLFVRSDPSVSPDDIIHAVCETCTVTRSMLAGPRRTKHLAEARQLAMYLLRQHTSLSLVEIGRLLCDRDHTTVLHACSKIDRLKEESSVRRKIDDVMRKLGGLVGGAA